MTSLLGLYFFQRKENKGLIKSWPCSENLDRSEGVLSFIVLIILAWFGRTTGLAERLSPGLVLNVAVTIALIVGWWFYLCWSICWSTAKPFLQQHNQLRFTWYRKLEAKYPWQEAMLKQAYFLLAAETFGLVFSVYLAYPSFQGILSHGVPSFGSIGVYLIIRYIKRYHQTVTSIGQVVDHIELIKHGNLDTRLELSEDDDMYQAAMNLNSIQEGMSAAVEEKTRSERMKVELITNVSHDLKTPLTSIISYIDLLAKEENLPEHLKDYIQILAQVERLKT